MNEPIKVREFRGRHFLSLPPDFQRFRDFKSLGHRDWLYYGYTDPMLRLWHREARRQA